MATAVSNRVECDPIFGSLAQVIDTGKRLFVLQKLDRIFPQKESRLKTIDQVVRVWGKATQNDQVSLEEKKETLKRKLLTKDLRSYYEPSIQEANDNAGLARVAQQAIRDLESIKLGSAFSFSLRGEKGPILFVRLKNPPDLHIQTFVLKKTTCDELVANRIYACLSRCSSKELQKPHHHGFVVPQSSGLDFRLACYENIYGKSVGIGKETNEELKKGFQDLMVRPKKLRGPVDYVMISQYISGANLFDFVSTQYALMEMDQKEKLFERLGRLAVIDVVLGVLDRLVQIRKKDDRFILDNLEANLGNVMVELSGGKMSVYAIDNELDPELVQNPESKKKYLEFLESLFKEKDIASTLAADIKASIITALNVEKQQDVASSFLNDLNQFAEKALIKSVNAMIGHLLVILSKQDVDTQFPHLREQNASLVDCVWERLQIFKGAIKQ